MKEIHDLATTYDPLPVPLDAKLQKEIKKFAAKHVNVIIQTCNRAEYYAALEKMKAATALLPMFDKPVKYPTVNDPDDEYTIIVVGTFAGKNAAIVRTGQGNKCRDDLKEILEGSHKDNLKAFFPHAKYLLGLGVCMGIKGKFGDVLIGKMVQIEENLKLENGKLVLRGTREVATQTMRNIFCDDTTGWKGFECTATAEGGTSEPRTSLVFSGCILSSPTLLNDSNIKQGLEKESQTLIGAEMEGWVLFTAFKNIESIIIKGISDYGDGTKADDWQLTAAKAAVDYAHFKLGENLRSDAMDSLGTIVTMRITNIGARGYPGTGKTSLLDLAMGKPVAPTRNSTGFVDPPSRYLVTKSEQSAAVVWDHVTTEKMFKMLCSASKKVIEEGLPNKDSNSHSKVKNPAALVSQADSLPKDREHSTSEGNEQETVPENGSQVIDTIQPSHSPPLPPSFPPPAPPYTIFPELLTQLANSGRSGVIFDSHWMMVTDCGGQPPFLDASVLFLRNSCLEIFPLKLNERLDEKSKFSFFIDGKPATIATSCLPLSNLQVIETLAKAVAAFQPPHTASAVESPKGAKFAIVGTFEDKKDECTETLDQKERILEKVLEPYKLNLVRSLQGKIILPVNAVTTDEVERKRYSESLQKLITHASGVTLKVEVKLRWFGFLLSLLTLSEKKKKPVLKLDECFKIGSSLEMDESETLRAIRFFHDIGVIMHFDTPKLEKEVIVEAKPVLDKVSQLLSVPFISLELLDEFYSIIPSAQAKERLQQQGRFDHELLEALNFTKPVTTQMFLDILEHVKAVVAVNGGDKHEYFMPCALDYASKDQCEPQSCSEYPPWVVKFRIKQGSYVFFIPLPVGYLPVLVVFLLTEFSSEFSTDRDAQQYRYLISLLYMKEMQELGRVFLLERHLQLEVYFTSAEELPQECLQIRNRILDAMHLTEKRLRYKEESITKVDCFLCSCEKSSIHINHVGEYNRTLKKVVCEKTKKKYSCNDFNCLHWIPKGTHALIQCVL